MKLRIFLIISLTLFSGLRAHAQTNDQAPVYKSDVDDQLTINRVSYMPFTDNLQGIYARPLEVDFGKMLDQTHRWNYIPPNITGAIYSPRDLENDPAKVKGAGASMKVDALFAAKITKGPSGASIHLSLFTTSNGLLLAQAELRNYQKFDIKNLKSQLENLYSQVLRKIPYSGRILSRDGNRVTVNLGTQNGLKNGQELSVIQIVKAVRHPKFHFLVSTEKELIGRIKILKVDDSLSFGVVSSERARGAVQKGGKLDSLDFVTYHNDDLSMNPSVVDHLEQRQDAKVAFKGGGSSTPQEWRPMNEPAYGQVGARIGLSRFSRAMNLDSGAISSHDDFAPLIAVDGELWLTPQWTIHAQIREAIMPIKNPRGSSSPGDLSESLTYYELLAGYRIRFGPSAWSAYAEPFVGYMDYKVFIDDSNPETYPTTEYNGLKFGVRGEFPITEDGRWSFGGSLGFVLAPSLRETPVTSGSSKNTIDQFNVVVSKKMSEHLKLQGQLDFELYSSSFSGTGTRSETATTASQRYMTLTGGIAYLF